ncbi:MAG: PKD domain-containing protein [Muribaculaceae bacterium]|nr:PKD domain-containing protein [Muribaculaceae bacterium]
MQKHFYSLLLLAVLLCGVPQLRAAEWSYDWPVPATQDKPDYLNGYYNFGGAADANLTTLTRTFGGMTWTATFDAGCILAYTSSAGQTVGQAGKVLTESFVMTSDSFSGKISSVTVKSRAIDAGSAVAVKVGQEALVCDGATSASIEGSAFVERTFTSAAGAEGRIELSFVTPNPTKPLYIKEIKVVYEEGESTVALPVITPAAGSYDEPFEVSIAAAEGAEVYYTTDGTSPRDGGLLYTAPFTVSESCTVKAVAKVGEDYSAVAEAKYVLRVSPGLSFVKDALTIELLEEDLALIDNPNRVDPITYSSSNNAVAYCDRYGHIYTYAVGECVIKATFAGNDKYLPQTIELPLTVVAKEPLAGFTVTPGEGVYGDAVEVTVSCTDPRAAAIWYYIGDEPMTLDDLGLLDEFKINASTTLKLTIDHSCVLSVQAVGENVWSEPKFVSYTVNMPLRADFAGPQSYTTVYRNGFDSLDEANEWKTSQGSQWQLTPDAGGFRDVPPFSSINPDSEYSIYHKYANTGDASVITSPDIVLPEGAAVRFYALFNPVWIYDGNLELYICENIDGAQPVKIWDAFLASQDAATDDIKWTQYTADLSDYAGKEVYFAYIYYLTNGDNVVIDDFEVLAPDGDGSSITVSVGEDVAFTNKSTGEPEVFAWTFEGADVATSTEASPVVRYSKAGTYSVALTVTRGEDTDTKVRDNYVVVKAQAPAAAIEVGPGAYYSPEASLVVPLDKEITFSDASRGVPTSYSWTLPGTDIGTSTDKSVTVKYVKEGMYDVDLTVANDAGSSSTYIAGVKAGGKSAVWNISAAENDRLAAIDLAWYGWYGGTNWLDMTAFAEAFEAPAVPAIISSVNVYFAMAQVISGDAPVKVAVTAVGADGAPAEELASATLPARELVDASETYNDPTEFVFAQPVRVDEPFFVTISGFPAESTDAGSDAVAMYALRRGEGGRNTAWHLLRETDDSYNYTGETKWYAQTDDPTSFAIAPRIEFESGQSGVGDVSVAGDDTVEWYTLQGVKVTGDRLLPGIYIRRTGTRAEKVVVR